MHETQEAIRQAEARDTGRAIREREKSGIRSAQVSEISNDIMLWKHRSKEVIRDELETSMRADHVKFGCCSKKVQFLMGSKNDQSRIILRKTILPTM